MSVAFVSGGGGEWRAVEVGMPGATAGADELADHARRATTDDLDALER